MAFHRGSIRASHPAVPGTWLLVKFNPIFFSFMTEVTLTGSLWRCILSKEIKDSKNQFINVFESQTATFSEIKNKELIRKKCSHGSCCHNKLEHSGNKISPYKSSIKRPSLAVLPNVSSTKKFPGLIQCKNLSDLFKTIISWSQWIFAAAGEA